MMAADARLIAWEKGYLHLGTDTDGSTSALDVGCGRMLPKPMDFIDKRSICVETISVRTATVANLCAPRHLEHGFADAAVGFAPA